MALSSEQVKGRIKNIAKNNNADARILIRIYMMDRFLERLSISKYKKNFIIKGGILVTSMLGVSMRSTMDIDATIKNFNLDIEETQKIVMDIISIELNDNVSFGFKKISKIMDNMEYPGVRIELDAIMGNMITPIKVDISTGDVITPKAIEYSYKLLIEDRNIQILSYNLETILAEKLQTILSRGVYNTRMRDFYDIFGLLNAYENQMNTTTFKEAFIATCQKRDTDTLCNEANTILTIISTNNDLKKLWEQYRKKYNYANEITYENAIKAIQKLINNLD